MTKGISTGLSVFCTVHPYDRHNTQTDRHTDHAMQCPVPTERSMGTSLDAEGVERDAERVLECRDWGGGLGRGIPQRVIPAPAKTHHCAHSLLPPVKSCTHHLRPKGQ